MQVLDVADIRKLIRTVGLKSLYLQLIDMLEEDFRQWSGFRKSSRHATHYDHGVIELMPCSNEQLYSFKYVNGHPGNTRQGKLCVAAMGLLADVSTGYPIMLSEMTLLTAIRTAAVAALGARYLAREDSHTLAIIGTGAQSEFQAQALLSLFDLEEIRIYDIDRQAMLKFTENMQSSNYRIMPCASIRQTIKPADIIITATAEKVRAELFSSSDIQPGTHIHAMGGDCPGKTELGPELLKKCKLVVEFTEQSLLEGEIQQLEAKHIYAELWEIIAGKCEARSNRDEITLLDSVGFALEDFSTLKLIHQLANELHLGRQIELIPELDDPKNLYTLIRQ